MPNRQEAHAAAQGRKRDLLDLHREIETFVHFSPWRDEVPTIPETPVAEWGTLAWARLALALLEAT